MFKNCSWCVPHVLLMVILFVSVGLMLGSSLQEAAIMDELAHIPAGYGYVKYLDFRLNPEHPPLIKAAAALPLLFMKLNFPTDLDPWTTALNGQWDAGRQFLYEVNDGRADEILFMSRLFPIVFTILLVVLVYAWSKKLFGPWWALVPALLTAFSPHILAHGHYVTTDIAASLGFFLGLLGFWIAFGQGSALTARPGLDMRGKLIVAGLLFGIAQLLKFSLVLLIPLYIFFIFALWLTGQRTWKHAWKLFRSLAYVFAVGFALVWAVYIVFTWNYPLDKQISDTTILLQEQVSKGSVVAKMIVGMSGVPIFRAIAHYGLGVIMVSQRSAGGNTAYFLGEDGNGGWWHYFPVVFLLKESLPALLILLGGIFFWIGRFFKNWVGVWKRMCSFVQEHTALFIMFVFVVFYWAYSIQSPLNIGFRHVLPTVPFLYILGVSSIKKWFDAAVVQSGLRHIARSALKHGLLGIMLLWVLVEAAMAYPHFISYYNEAGGGKWGGYVHAVDSNYDWGQDLKRLQEYVQEQNIRKIAVDYFGGGHVPYYVPNAIPWEESKGNPLSENAEWLAVSINELIYDIHAIDPEGAQYGHRRYRWLQNPLQPYARIGTSIFVYRLR
ncbi:hypothetical protein A2755_01785 [Candidatus Wolfebacteria bacterium RIFCSPHIGHO2_01_FULL_48_22]|uniref:Glycosyltransferase RgtA/B/C/D-like domain-containing protein n=1 Tax=Candidatus Wolfebacteria bacterium RIFCSPHIGHO2_01_FULL_48_22 TaxID=1802555 RepID=A0A1F8DQM9_9BACT|nr:MAG: hypothetical protein A2755_01785 [Candidatus Wolfebacteria bacterium RIFCSPHIGHO2_01_FULL_48_22]